MKKPERKYLCQCFRCEHRALFLESKGSLRPRCECGDIHGGSYCCYMYKPVRPLALERVDRDKRPLLGPAVIAARAQGFLPPEESGRYKAAVIEGAVVPYWMPRIPRNKKEKKP